MVNKGLLHVKKYHSRRWDYYLTPYGISEKARLTYEFLDFSMHFYKEARRTSSEICAGLAEKGARKVAFIGAGDLAEIVYLGIKEWNLTLTEVFSDSEKEFLGLEVRPLSVYAHSKAEYIIVCVYDSMSPLTKKYLPAGVEKLDNMIWIFT